MSSVLMTRAGELDHSLASQSHLSGKTSIGVSASTGA